MHKVSWCIRCRITLGLAFGTGGKPQIYFNLPDASRFTTEVRGLHLSLPPSSLRVGESHGLPGLLGFSGTLCQVPLESTTPRYLHI